MKELLQFDLQRFADESVQPTVDTVVEQTVETTPAETTPAVVEDNKPKFEFILDEKGNLIWNEEFATEPETPVKEEPAQQQEFYTPEEIEQIGIDKLDPNKIPPELVPFYKRMQADYTRKTQELSTKSKDLEAKLAEINTPKPPEAPKVEVPAQPPVDPVQQQRQYYEEVFRVAKDKVEKALGQPFDEINTLHQVALADEVASIKAYVVQEQLRQQQLNQVVSRYSSDAEWSNIQKYAENVLNTLPYQQSHAIRTRLQSGDIDFLNDFLQVSKDEYYKSKNPTLPQTIQSTVVKPVVKPPVVETAGTGITTPDLKNFDTKKLGQMTNDAQADMFVRLGLTKL